MTNNNQDHRSADDEIDLRELCVLLWRGRWLIVVVFLLVLGFSAAYAFLAKPVYHVEFRLLPPTRAQLASYHSLVEQLDRLMPKDPDQTLTLSTQPQDRNALPDGDDLYNRFVQNLLSNEVKSEFFKKVFIPDLYGKDAQVDAQRQDGLDEALTITPPKKDKVDTTMAFEGGDPKQLGIWLNSYIDMAQELSRSQTEKALAARKSLVQELIGHRIDALRHEAKISRQATIDQVEHALDVARGIGLQEAAPQTQWSDSMANGGDLMYLQGTRALTAILAELKSRTNDDAYISELPSLMERDRQLRQLDVEPKLEFAYIDRPAFLPNEPVNPDSLLVMVVGSFLGLILGGLLVFVRHAWRPIA